MLPGADRRFLCLLSHARHSELFLCRIGKVTGRSYSFEAEMQAEGFSNEGSLKTPHIGFRFDYSVSNTADLSFSQSGAEIYIVKESLGNKKKLEKRKELKKVRELQKN